MFVRVAHSVRQPHGQFILNLFNEIVSEKPLAPQKHRGMWMFVHVAHSARQIHEQLLFNLFDEIVSEKPLAPQNLCRLIYMKLNAD